jgi:hypothetical protein
VAINISGRSKCLDVMQIVQKYTTPEVLAIKSTGLTMRRSRFSSNKNAAFMLWCLKIEL